MTRYFYRYQKPESSDAIMARIRVLEADIAKALETIAKDGE